MFVPLQSHSENIQKNPKESAEIAQLVEHNLAQVGVASSSLVFRSRRGRLDAALNFEITRRGSIICRSSFTKATFSVFMGLPACEFADDETALEVFS